MSLAWRLPLYRLPNERDPASNTEMLKITISDSATEQTWTLQGSLSGPWVALLDGNWKNQEHSRQGKSCVIDVSQLTFVDRSGEQVLRAMKDEGAQFIGCRVYMKDVIEHFERRQKESVP
jgi:ABC-type transporter Mla MlaB component